MCIRDRDNDGLELGNAEDTGQIENVFKHQRTGVKDYRDLHEQIQNNVSDGEPQLGGSVVALAEQLRDGGDAALQVARCGEQRQHDELSLIHICSMYDTLLACAELAEKEEINLNLEALNITTDHVRCV